MNFSFGALLIRLSRRAAAGLFCTCGTFAASDLALQKKIAAEIQIQAFQDVPYYPLGLYYRQSAYRANLSGVLHGIPVFWNVQRT